MTTKFVCVCGKNFHSQKSLSAHMINCKEHYLQRDGNLDNYLKYKNKICEVNRDKLIIDKRIKKYKETVHNKQKLKLEQWINEKHRCERCGKIMDSYYGSGRFCSVSCANSHPMSTELKVKISEALSKNNNHAIKVNYKDKTLYANKKVRAIVRLLNVLNYYFINEPKKCCICNKIIKYDSKNNKTCSVECKNKLLSYNTKKRGLGGYVMFSGSNKQCKGYYKGYYCDSTWELAYVIYNLEHHIKFKRCTRKYKYFYEGKEHTYNPDFELDDGTVIEIKGYRWVDDKLDYKIASVNDTNIVVLYEKDLKDMFKYVIDKYGKDFKKLYENSS